MKQKFFWGCASAAAQIEGAYLEDDRTPSIWDVVEEKIANNDTCHDGCDFYHHYKEDIKLLSEMGVNSFRISISWSRIFPSRGFVNYKGIEFYNSVINEMLKYGIEPMVTLFHWDLPVWIHNLGGWENEEIIILFEEYARVVAKSFSDRVKYWFVFNEPQIFLTNGYYEGTTVPFIINKKSFSETTKIALMAHKKAVDALRINCVLKPKIGIAMATSIFVPNHETFEEIEHAKNKTFNSEYGKLWNTWYADPLLCNKPVKINEFLEIKQEDLINIYSPLDFLGINIYLPATDDEYIPISEERTATNWVVDERCIYWVCKYFSERFKLPIIISENGYAKEDKIINGKINDIERISFIQKYVNKMLQAKSEGVDIFGYLYWSIMDNFEWLAGYRPRFGLIYVDYITKKRILKESAYAYKNIIEKTTF